MFELLRGTWRFRDFIVASIKREFVSRYLGTQLGIVWAVAHPLALILIYTLVFAELMKPRLPGHESKFAYSIYLTAGFITWSLFSDLLTRSVGIFVHNANLLKKVTIHKLALPVIAFGSAFLQFSIFLGIFVFFLVITGNFPGAVVVAVIPILIITSLLAMGLGLLLATVNVFYRDVEQSTSLVLQFWFWLTPIVYPSEALPAALKAVLAWNPLWPLVVGMQAVFVESRPPNWNALAYPLALAIVLAILARLAFGRLGHELVDEL